jgi:hypothetical protein
MTELRPLLESTKDDLERALLMSARAELPSGLGLRDTALALGLAGPTAEALATSLTAASSLSQAGAPLASATAASTTAATSGGVPSAVAAASLGVMGKSLLGGALVSFLALTTLDYSLRSSPSRPDPVLVANRVTAVSRAPDVPPALPAPAIPPVSPDADPAPAPAVVVSGGVAPRSALSRLKPSVPALAPAPAPVPAPSNEAVVLPPPPPPPPPPPQPPRVTPNVSLAVEIRLLDQARAALAAGDSTYAAALLDRYAANRPSAVLAQEAALLRVRLLIKQGDRRGATQLARRIILEYPESRHVDSLRSLAAEP